MRSHSSRHAETPSVTPCSVRFSSGNAQHAQAALPLAATRQHAARRPALLLGVLLTCASMPVWAINQAINNAALAQANKAQHTRKLLWKVERAPTNGYTVSSHLLSTDPGANGFTHTFVGGVNRENAATGSHFLHQDGNAEERHDAIEHVKGTATPAPSLAASKRIAIRPKPGKGESPDDHGIYNADVWARTGGRPNQAFNAKSSGGSTLFPAHMTSTEVVAAIQHAWQTAAPVPGKPLMYRGKSGPEADAMDIELIMQRDDKNAQTLLSAYPRKKLRKTPATSAGAASLANWKAPTLLNGKVDMEEHNVEHSAIARVFRGGVIWNATTEQDEALAPSVYIKDPPPGTPGKRWTHELRSTDTIPGITTAGVVDPRTKHQLRTVQRILQPVDPAEQTADTVWRAKFWARHHVRGTWVEAPEQSMFPVNWSESKIANLIEDARINGKLSKTGGWRYWKDPVSKVIIRLFLGPDGRIINAYPKHALDNC